MKEGQKRRAAELPPDQRVDYILSIVGKMDASAETLARRLIKMDEEAPGAKFQAVLTYSCIYIYIYIYIKMFDGLS